MKTIFLSPHLDDAVFSFGGPIWEQVNNGEDIEIWTLFSNGSTGMPLTPFADSLHQRWKAGEDPYLIRQNEDIRACRILGCGWKHLGFSDCIYRWLPEGKKPLINKEEDLFLPIHPAENALVRNIAEKIKNLLPEESTLATPLAVGGHVDHRICRQAAELLGRDLAFFADFPYAHRNSIQLEEVLLPDWLEQKWRLSDTGLKKWQLAIAAYESQVSSFWNSIAEMEREIDHFAYSVMGCCWWVYHPPIIKD